MQLLFITKQILTANDTNVFNIFGEFPKVARPYFALDERSFMHISPACNLGGPMQ